MLFATKTFSYAEHSAASIKRIRAVQGQGGNFDTRTHLQYITDNELVGNRLYPRIPPKEFNKTNGLKTASGRLFPLGGVSNRSTVYCNNYGEYLLFESDQWGLRNPSHAHRNRPLDVLVVGDSFSMGHCVDNDIASLLRRREMNVLSVAYSGNGPLLELATLREYGARKSPKVVLWLYYEGNDLRDLGTEKKQALLMSYLRSDFSQGLASKQAEVDALLERYIKKERAKKMEKSSWSSVVRLVGVRILLKKSVKQLFSKKDLPEADLGLFERVLRQAKADISSWNGQMIFVYLPEWNRFAHPDDPAVLNPWLRYRDEILALVQKLNIPTVDITDVMALADDPKEYFPHGLRGHYTKEGYAIVDQEISKKLIEVSTTDERISVQ